MGIKWYLSILSRFQGSDIQYITTVVTVSGNSFDIRRLINRVIATTGDKNLIPKSFGKD